MIVFDPRYPHGVTRVNGVEDLLDARLVIHGWFTEPRPMIEGALSIKKAMPSMDTIAEFLLETFSHSDLSGVFCTRIIISPSGKISSIQVITSHLIHTETGQIVSKKWVEELLVYCSHITFPKSTGTTKITLPIEIKK